MRNRTALLIMLIGLFLLPVGAYADGLSWSLFPPTGTTNWDPAATGQLIGQNITVKSVASKGTPLDNGQTFTITDGILNFSTAADFAGWGWGAGGSYTVTGCIAGITSAVCTGAPTDVVLLSGDFSGPVSLLPAGANYIVFGTIEGTLNHSVASSFGIYSSYSVGSLNNTIQNNGLIPNAAFNTTNGGGALGTAPSVGVSEDWTVFFGFSFFAFAIATFGLASRFGLFRPIGW